MSSRALHVLGTASQVPTRYRNHNGYFLRWDDEGFLFDPGEGTQRQMIYSNLSATDITRVLITHFHGDHCLGLAGVVQRISLDEVPHPVHVCFPASGRVYYDRLRRASIFRNRATLRPAPIDAPGPVWKTDKFTISALELDHGVEAWGYRVEEHAGHTMLPDKLREAGVQGRQIGELSRQGSVEVDGRTVLLEDVSVPRPGQSVAVVMDTRWCRNAVELARGVDMLVCESTYLNSEAREARAHGHLTAREAAQIAREAGAKKLVLTHFSQRYPSLRPFVEEASAIHPDVVAASDGDVYELPRRRKKGR